MRNREEILNNICNDTIDGEEIIGLIEEALTFGLEARDILFEALTPALEEVGRLFEDEKLFVPEMVMAANSMSRGMDLLRPLIAASGVKPTGRFVMGTVFGDTHDIGKNLCNVMLEGAGFEVIDLGVNVSPEKFITAILEHKPNAVGISAFLTTTMPMLENTIGSIAEADLRDGVIILVGGAPVTPEYAAQTGANGYAPDAPSCVRVTKELLGLK